MYCRSDSVKGDVGEFDAAEKNETINAKINASGFFLWTLLCFRCSAFPVDVLRKPSIAPLFL